MSKSYTAAIIGCGSIAHSHMQGYQLVDNVDVVAVVDPLKTARNQYVEEYGIPQQFPTIEKMLEKARPDIVSVCTWHLLHPSQTIAAAQAGVKGIICEKPMAIGLGAADRMVEACHNSGTKLVIGHQRRFTPGWEKARDLIRRQAIGSPLWVNCKVADGLTNWGTHVIDGARFVLDEPSTLWVMGAVERRTERYERGTPIEDCCMGLVQMEENIQLFIQSDLGTRDASAEGFFVHGSEGALDIHQAGVRLFNGTSNGWQQIDLGVEETEIRGIGGQTHAVQLRELVGWIEGGAEHRGSGRRARDTVEIMMALYESARRHEVVHLPLREKDYPLEMMLEEGSLPAKQPGTYDIRGFLQRQGVDEDEYSLMRSRGVPHFQIMRKLQGKAR